MTRLLALGLVVCTFAAPTLAQVEVVAIPGTPPHPVYDILRSGRDIAAAPDGGMCVTGGDVRAVRFDAGGALAWETVYEWDPMLYLSLSAESIQRVTTDEGWIIGAAGSSWNPKESECFPANNALIRIKESGEVAWAVRFAGDYRDDYVGYKYPPNIQVRELPDGSFFAVSTRITRDPRNNCARLCPQSSTGVAIRVDGSGNVLFAREYGYSGQGAKSELLFADLTVVDDTVWVLGTVDPEGGCLNGTFNINTLLIQMDFQGNVLQSFEIERPDADGEDDWASSICSIEKRLYFAFLDHMPHYEAADSTIACFDTSSNSLAWANVHPTFHVNYGTLEPGNPGTIIAGGHRGISENHASEIDIGTGLPIWQMRYKDPAGYPNYLGEIAGGCLGGPAGGYWLLTSSSLSMLYMLGTDPAGNTVCSSTEDPIRVRRAEVRVRRASVDHFRRIPTLDFKPEAVFLPTETLDPCRR
jgi:hypothetical protein